MEEDSEDLEEDSQEEGKPTVLWEKCFQQSILFELSEDESLHLSDLERSLALHMSQAESAASEESIHLSGCAELSELEDSSSENSACSSNSVNAVENKSKSVILNQSVQRLNTMGDELSFKQRLEDPGQNTSDEDQDDLPYDADLGSPYFNQTFSSLGNSDEGDTVHGSPDLLDLPEKDQNTTTKSDESFEAIKQTEVAPPCPVLTDITHLLLQHFSPEELLGPERLIEAETLPEVSLLESVDDSAFSLATKTSTLANHSHKTDCSQERPHVASKKEISEEKTNYLTSAATEKNLSSSASLNQSTGDTCVYKTEQNKTEEDDQNQRVPLIRTRSFSEMKYGQGQVHYPLPDFSKVAPKVKIPKTQSGPIRPVPQSANTIHRAGSSPGMLEVISRVLEDSIPPSETPYVFKDSQNQTPPAPSENDRLLIRCAESENLEHQMKPEPNAQSPSDDVEKQLEFSGETRPVVFPLPRSENIVEKKGESTQRLIVKETTKVLSNHNKHVVSDGEKMTAELREIVVQFMEKVEEFKCNVTDMAISTAEQHIMLRSMMEAQDELERKYIRRKEEHRALEMQNYMGLSRNTGIFDPDRLVEGDIFRIGMHLEDVKEIIDRNTYEQISPPHSSSTPTSITSSLLMNPRSLSFHTSSPPPAPSLQQGKNTGFYTESYEEDAQKEDKGEDEDTREVHVNVGSCGLRTADLLKETVGQPISNSQLSSPSCFSNRLSSLEGLQTVEVKQETPSGLSGGIDHRDILAYLSGSRSPPDQRQWTTDSVVLNTSVEGEVGDCGSLVVEVSCCSHSPRDVNNRISEPGLNTSCVSQMILSSETDSGFGSSYLNQSATETCPPNVLTGSSYSNCNYLDNSDSEASCSNLETAVHTVAAAAHSSIQTLHCETAAAAVELWVESTSKEPSVRLQRTDQKKHAPLHHHIPEQTISTTMEAEDRRSPLNTCSCNSEAILALQTEVSKLKKDLELGLFQLPHLTQRMDYLTSRYRQEDSDRRSKIRTQQTPDSNDLGQSSNRGRSNLTSSLLSIDDWISSDMEQSKRKAPKSFNVKERWCPSLQKPLLQVNYGSSCSLPASYKMREPQLQSTSCQRKRSTQSDTALLPSNVYFQKTPSPVSGPLRATSRRKGKKEEDMSRTLDEAIEVARIMKKTTDRMARRLSADLAKAQLNKKLYNTEPQGGRKHHTF